MGLSRPFWLPPNHRQGEDPITMTVTDQLERTKKFVPIFRQVNVTFKTMKNCKTPLPVLFVTWFSFNNPTLKKLHDFKEAAASLP